MMKSVGKKRPLRGSSRTIASEILAVAGVSPSANVFTKSGWCLREGLTHIMNVDNGRMIPVVRQHGPPLVYDITSKQQTCRHDHLNSADSPPVPNDENLDQLKNQPQNCFQSLCRIVAGQQLAGNAAMSVWNRLLTTCNHSLTPTTIIKLANNGMEEHLQKPAGLSKAKTRSIIALAHAFKEESDSDDKMADVRLSDRFLTTSEDVTIRESLLRVKGIGPWSCDMFMMFYLERQNIFPVGDLGVRKGIAKLFQLRGKAKGGALCPKLDLALMEETLEPYKPFRSLVAYYMWKVADTKDFYNDASQKSEIEKLERKSKRTQVHSEETSDAAATLVHSRRMLSRKVTQNHEELNCQSASPSPRSTSTRALSRKTRVYAFRDFLIQVYGKYLDQPDKKGVVLDVAGGKGDLSWLLCNVDDIVSVVLDPRGDVSKCAIPRSVQYLKEHPKEAKRRAVPGFPTHQPLATLISKLMHKNEFVAPKHLTIHLDQEFVDKIRSVVSKEQDCHAGWTAFWLRRMEEQHFLVKDSSIYSTKDTNIINAMDALQTVLSAKLVAGFHPDQATDYCVQLAEILDVPFCIVPCCVFPSEFPSRKINSTDEHVRSYTQLIQFLQEKCPQAKTAYLDFHFAETAKNLVLYTLPPP